MRIRKRCARFSATVKGQEWRFVWEPSVGRLIARRKHARRRQYLIATAEQLVDLMQGQLMLL